MIEVNQVTTFSDNYIWFIVNRANNHVAIVDLGDAIPVIEKINAEKLIPYAILITHHHHDHTSGVEELLQQFDIPVYGPANENIAHRSHALQDGDIVNLEKLAISFDILDVPGHTSGAIAYYGNDMVFVGDTLFMSGCGRLFEGTPEQMYQSLTKLASLPEYTQVYCAHEYTMANLQFALTVEPDNKWIKNRIEKCKNLRENNTPTVPAPIYEEKQTNPFLRVDKIGVVQAASKYVERPLTAEEEVFTAVRQWKDNF